MFCVYLTLYFGNKLPRRYIGSSSVEKVLEGYNGTPLSKKWKTIFREEQEQNPHLFKTRILSTHNTRESATEKELELQKKYDVVRSSKYFNESLAIVDGCFGRDVSGELNPMFGNGQAIRKWSEENPEKASERSRKAANTQWSDPEQRKIKIDGMIGKKKTRKTQTQEEFVQLQREKQKKALENFLLKKTNKLHYNDRVYFGFGEFERETGITKYFAKKMIEKGEIEVTPPE